MRFWDASAVVPLLLTEPATPQVESLYRDDPRILVWWATEIECVSAVARRERERAITRAMASFALERLDRLVGTWEEVQPAAAVRRVARRLLRVHPLRSADAQQLSAALALGRFAGGIPFVCLDSRLADAAAREGLSVLPGDA